MLELLSYGFMQRAIVAGGVIGVVAPVIGVFMVLRRLSLVADTLSHTAFAGVALALLLRTYPLLGALGVALLAAVGIERLRARGQLSGEAALAVFLAGGLALGVVLLSLVRGFHADLLGYLFGALTAVGPQDLWLMIPLGVVALATVAVLQKELFAITFDEESARVQGVPVDELNLLFTVLVAAVVVAAMRVVGILLTSALMVLPPLAAMRIARSFRATVLLSVAASLVSVVVGLLSAYSLDVAPSGAIVLCALLLFAMSASLSRR